MASPFEKLLYKALKKSTAADNVILKEAEKIIAKGYPEAEIIDVLERFKKGLLDDEEREIVVDALDELTDEY